ncbi:MAG TPA: RidA family protein [Bdellovibrionota bacterium]|jgi:2-iminobutanoate/2-iminopropanoate deaminase|nr:RidA family protein [Bdellovibrionota bacterium]
MPKKKKDARRASGRAEKSKKAPAKKKSSAPKKATTSPVLTKAAPAPIGPYSQAIRAGGLLFCSGQIALDPASGQIAPGGVQEQTARAMENLKAVLEEGGAGFGRVVKTTIFLKSMSDFPQVNEVYGRYFTGTPPARSTVEVSRLPKDVLVEIEAVALL